MSNQDQICEVAREKLLPWLAGQLDGTPDGVEFEEHVKQCPTCTELVSDRRRAMQVLLALADAKDGAKAEKATGKSLQVPAWKAFLESKGVPVLAAVAVILLGLSYFMKPGDGLLGEKALPETESAPPSTAASEETTTTHAQTTASESQQPAESTTDGTEAAEKPETAQTDVEPQSQPAATVAESNPPAGTQPTAPTSSAKTTQGAKPAQKTSPAPKRRTPSSTPKSRTTNSNPKKNSGEGRVEVYDEGGRLVGTATTGGNQ
ncbi:MAG: hypothetical protein KatS3mg015_1733 [Fimbriimonadales bacterium]|nr:MAG: hypothetical protein KatS3mg015_1733 [Fimbriimonadales bacterium]